MMVAGMKILTSNNKVALGVECSVYTVQCHTGILVHCSNGKHPAASEGIWIPPGIYPQQMWDRKRTIALSLAQLRIS